MFIMSWRVVYHCRVKRKDSRLLKCVGCYPYGFLQTSGYFIPCHLTRRLRSSFVNVWTADTQSCFNSPNIPTSNSCIMNITLLSSMKRIMPLILSCHFACNYPILMKLFVFFIIFNSFSCILRCNKVKI